MRSMNRTALNSDLSSRTEPLTASGLRIQTPRIQNGQRLVTQTQNLELRRIQLIQKQKDADRQQLRSVSAKAKQIMTMRMDQSGFAGRLDTRIIPVDLFATPTHVSCDYRPQSVMRSVSSHVRSSRAEPRAYERPTDVRVDPPEESEVFFQRYQRAALEEDSVAQKELERQIAVQKELQNPDIPLFQLNLETMRQRRSLLEEARYCAEITETMRFFDGELAKLKPRILTSKYVRGGGTQIQSLKEKLAMSRQLSSTYEAEQKAIHTDIIAKRQGMLTGRLADQAKKQQGKVEDEHREKITAILNQLQQYLKQNPSQITKEMKYEGIDTTDVEQLKTFETDAGNPLLQQFLYLYQFEEAVELIHGCSRDMDSWVSKVRKQVHYQAVDLLLLGQSLKTQYEKDTQKRIKELRSQLSSLTGSQLQSRKDQIALEEEQLQKVKACLEVPQIKQQIAEAEKKRRAAQGQEEDDNTEDDE